MCGGKKGMCLPKSNYQIKRLEFILLEGLWLGIRDRLGESGQGNRRQCSTDRFWTRGPNN